jgi:hypothetical protein
MKKILAGLLFVPVVASAGFHTGNELYSDLLSESTSKRMYGLGYLAGLADYGDSVSHCIPSNVTLGQIQDMAIDYLRKNAENRNLPADILVGMMLIERWPCKEKKKGRGA